jgi:hypothetical protein
VRRDPGKALRRNIGPGATIVANAVNRAPLPALTVVELAGRLHAPQFYVGRLLVELEAEGLAELDGGGRWRLSAGGEREFGIALRGLTVGEDSDGHYTGCRRHPVA